MSERPVIDVEENSEFRDSLVISCFPSEGFVSSIVAHFLVDRLGLELVGGIRHSGLPPVCLVQDGSPLPPIRLYSGVPICNVEKCDKVVLIASEIQISPDLKLPIASEILDWMHETDASKAIMIDSYAHGEGQKHSIFDEDKRPDTVVGIGATEKSREILEEIGANLLKQGVVGGMTGVMLGESRRRKVDSLAIIAESGGEFSGGGIPDARAAARIIECLDGLLPAVKLDPEPLLEEAQRIEEQIREMMTLHLNSEPDVVSAPSTMYG
tara:strand:+ start:5918 stop:6721 length:804 start_codon:yes stop_codon:yes gene_type:complete